MRFEGLYWRVFGQHLWQSAPLESERPVLILGSGRSGNTLLRRILIASREVLLPPETYFFPQFLRRLRAELRRGDRERAVVTSLRWLEQDPAFQETVGLSTSGLQAFASELLAVGDELPGSTVFAALHRSVLVPTPGRERWGNKTPLLALHARSLAIGFPKGQFIFPVRDPVDVAASARRFLGWSIPQAVSRWLAANQEMLWLERRRPEQVLRVRYEDLVREPRTEVARIRAFLQLEASVDEMLRIPEVPMGDVEVYAHHQRVKRPIDASSIGKGLRELSPEEVDFVRRRTARIARRLGYV